MRSKITAFSNIALFDSFDLLQTRKTGSSTVNFEGVDIRSEFLPTLETIWAKHGTLFGKNSVRSKAMRAYALESLAKLNITLQRAKVKDLTDSTVDEIQLILDDLNRVGLKVDWLAPMVEEAKTQHNEKKLRMERIKMLRIDMEEKEFMERSAKKRRELEEKMTRLSTGIISSEF